MEDIQVIVTLAIGFALVFGLQIYVSRRRAGSEDRVMKGYFLLGLSGLMAKIAMADGKVTDDEIALAERFFGKMNLSSSERAMCIGNFVTARRDGQGVRDCAKRFLAYANPVACEFLFDLLWRLSMADGVMDPAEDKLLANVGECLGLGPEVHERFRKGVRPTYDRRALRSAGVPDSLVALAGEESL